MFSRSIWEDMNDFRNSFDQLFSNLSTNSGTNRESNGFAFVPTVETGWTPEALNLRFVVPGVAESDLKITVQGNQILLQGERKAPEGFAASGHGVWHLAYGKFERVLDLPAGLEVSKMSAHLHDGVLDLSIPRAEAMKPRQIPIQVETKKTEKLHAAA